MNLRLRYLLLPALLAGIGSANAETPSDRALFRSIYKELVEINTADSVGSTTVAAGAVAAYYDSEEFLYRLTKELSSGKVVP